MIKVIVCFILCMFSLNSSNSKEVSQNIKQCTALASAIDAQEAIKCLLTHIQNNPNDDIAMSYLSSTYFRHNDSQNALNTINMAIKINPSYEYYFAQFMIYLNLKDIKSAQNSITNAINAQDSEKLVKAELLNNRGFLNLNEKSSISDFTNSIEIAQKEGNSIGKTGILFNAYLGLCTSYIIQKNYNDAVENCHNAYQIDKNNTNLLTNYMSALIEIKDYKTVIYILHDVPALVIESNIPLCLNAAAAYFQQDISQNDNSRVNGIRYYRVAQNLANNQNDKSLVDNFRAYWHL